VGKAFVAAFNFVCQLGEALVGALINTGKLLVNRLGALFSTERMRKFLGSFSNGMNGGFSLLGARIQENFSFVAEGALALANAASNFGSSVLNFFMNPSLDNFIGVVSSFLALGVESFVFILNIGVFLLTVLADVVGAIVNFFSDVGSWIQSSIIGPIVGALSYAASEVANWILSLF
jgi:Flp pilus assembly pilin Flp